MSRRVFTPKGRKEQLQEQVLLMIRVIRRKLDDDILQFAQDMAVKALPSNTNNNSPANKLQDDPRSNSESVVYDKENARAAIASLLVLKRDQPELSKKILAALKQSH